MFKSRYFLRGTLTGTTITSAYLFIVFGKKMKTMRDEFEAEKEQLLSKPSETDLLSQDPALAGRVTVSRFVQFADSYTRRGKRMIERK